MSEQTHEEEPANGVQISLEPLPPAPETALTIHSVDVTDRVTIPSATINTRNGTTVSVEDAVTRSDGGGGKQTVYKR